MFLGKIFGKKDLAIFVLGAVFAFAYMFANLGAGFLFNMINLFFVIGIFYVSIGCCVYIRNVGLFKSFAYMAYKRKYRRYGNPDPTARPLSMAEYAMELSKKRGSFREYFIVGLPFLTASFAMAFAIQF